MAIGIDFGTTNSSVVYRDFDGSRPVAIGSDSDPYDVVLRTAVLDPGSAEERVGQEAIDHAAQHGDRLLLTSFKPKLGVERLREIRRVPRQVRTGAYDFTNDADATKTVWDERAVYDERSRTEVVGGATAILRRLLEAVQEQEGLTPVQFKEEPIFLGVPIGYGPTARRRLLHALVDTGLFGVGGSGCRQVLRQVRFVYEPLALLDAHRTVDGGPETVLLFDFGGGTLDLALWRGHFDGDTPRYEELALGGLDWAGDRLDDLLIDHLKAAHPQYARALEEMTSPYERLSTRRRVTDAKERLSTHDQHQIDEPGLPPITVTTEDLEEAFRPGLSEVEEAVDRLLRRGDCWRREVDRVIIGGGSSLLPSVQRLLWRIFPAIDEHGETTWPQASRENGSRDAITAIADGLARMAFEDAASVGMAKTLPGDVMIWNDADAEMEVIGRRGGDLSVATTIKRKPGIHSVAFYEHITADRFLACVPDVRVTNGSVLRVEATFRRFDAFPDIRIVGKDGQVVGELNLAELSDNKLDGFIRSDDVAPVRATQGVLRRPLRRGDVVSFPGSGTDGVVRSIRVIEGNREVEQMEDWSLHRHQVWVEIEGQSQRREIRSHADVIL